jgi:hypothetical protein
VDWQIVSVADCPRSFNKTNEIAAWPDIILREQRRADAVHEDSVRLDRPALKQTVGCIGKRNSPAQSTKEQGPAGRSLTGSRINRLHAVGQPV